MISPLPTPLSLEPTPEELSRIEGIAGVLLQEDGRILINEFPLGEDKAARLAGQVDKMFRGYRKVRRLIRQIVIGYPCGLLVISSRDDAQLVLLLLDDSKLDDAAQIASAYLSRRYSKPLRLPQAS